MIFSIEKRRFRRGGKLEETRSYYLRYRIGDMPVDKWKSLGVTDKQVADKKAHEFIQERERETAGILEPKAVRDSAKKALTAHLDDYVADLTARGRNGRGGRGARLVASRIRALLQECDWQVPCNVTADSFSAWRNRQTCSPRTLNHYLQGMISLLNWMERVGRIKTNPLKNVGKADERGKQKRVRRAFTDEELRKLVAGSEDRGIIYFTAARTGLRQEELKQMKWGDLRLDANVPFVVVRDYAAKNKKKESVQLVPEIVEALTAHRPAGCTATDVVFPNGIPRARRLTLDLEANGIPYRDELGRYGDFHALRYTWATFLQRNGVAQRFAMKLMRHSDIRLTAQVYTDEMQLPIYDAIKNLPRLDAVPGYTQIRAQILGGNGQTGSPPEANSGGSNTHKTIVNSGVCHGLAEPVTTCQVERVKGIEPSSLPLSREVTNDSGSRRWQPGVLAFPPGLGFAAGSTLTAMNRYEFHLSITAEQYLDYYRGTARHVLVRCATGQTVQFPASLLQQFVTPEGINGNFALSCDEHHRHPHLERLKD
jgi:integrase